MFVLWTLSYLAKYYNIPVMYLHFDHWSKVYIGLPEKISDKLYVLNVLLILQKQH